MKFKYLEVRKVFIFKCDFEEKLGPISIYRKESKNQVVQLSTEKIFKVEQDAEVRPVIL